MVVKDTSIVEKLGEKRYKYRPNFGDRAVAVDCEQSEFKDK